MTQQNIPIAPLTITSPEKTERFTRPILKNEIAGIHVEHVSLPATQETTDYPQEGHKAIYLFMQGNGVATAEQTRYEIVPETILLPNIAPDITIKAATDTPLHYLKISSQLTTQDQIDLSQFPQSHTQHVYYAKFTDCQAYTEKIKSPKTVSRTILPNKYIPRIAMGTVQTTGPDEVGAHKHPMLEQLFLGLANNDCVVHADDAQVGFSQYTVLHIPLGSTHSVSVEPNKTMYYVWIDFFLDKEGEEWLKTHKVIEDNK